MIADMRLTINGHARCGSMPVCGAILLTFWNAALTHPAAGSSIPPLRPTSTTRDSTTNLSARSFSGIVTERFRVRLISPSNAQTRLRYSLLVSSGVAPSTRR